jgi:hypothetical protein
MCVVTTERAARDGHDPGMVRGLSAAFAVVSQ